VLVPYPPAGTPCLFYRLLLEETPNLAKWSNTIFCRPFRAVGEKKNNSG
jgi:hypothetical protein